MTKGIKERNQIDIDSFVEELKKVAFADIRQLFNDAGELKPINELQHEYSSFIKILEKQEVVKRNKNEITIQKISIHLWNKFSAISQLLKLVGGHEYYAQQQEQIDQDVFLKVVHGFSSKVKEELRNILNNSK